MKIIYDAGIDLSTFGGAVTHVIQKSNALIKRGVDVEIWALNKPKNTMDKKIIMVELVKTKNMPSRYLYYILYELISAWKLLFTNRKNTVYLVRQRIYSLPSLFVAKIRSIPSVYEVNDNTFDQLRIERKLTSLKKLFIYVIYYSALNISSVVVALTEDIKNYLIKSFDIKSSKIHVIPVGSNLEIFYPKDQSKSRQKLMFSDDKKYLINVGTFTAWSGIDVIIKIISKLRNLRNDLHFICVGDGRHKSNYIELASKLGVNDIVSFIGKIPYYNVPDYINAADLCFCIKTEKLLTTSPTRLFEYLSCGKPVIVTAGYKKNVNIESLIEISSERIDEASEIISNLLNDKHRLEYLSKISLFYASKNKSWDTIAEKLILLFSSKIAA